MNRASVSKALLDRLVHNGVRRTSARGMSDLLAVLGGGSCLPNHLPDISGRGPNFSGTPLPSRIVSVGRCVGNVSAFVRCLAG